MQYSYWSKDNSTNYKQTGIIVTAYELNQKAYNRNLGFNCHYNIFIPGYFSVRQFHDITRLLSNKDCNLSSNKTIRPTVVIVIAHFMGLHPSMAHYLLKNNIVFLMCFVLLNQPVTRHNTTIVQHCRASGGIRPGFYMWAVKKKIAMQQLTHNRSSVGFTLSALGSSFIIGMIKIYNIINTKYFKFHESK